MKNKTKNLKKPNPELQLKPFFILGCQRSGTTLLGLFLDGHSKICVPPELNFINSFCNTMTDDRFVMSFDSIGIDESELNNKLFDFINDILIGYSKSVGKKGRVIVTPQLIRVSDDIHLWSDSYDRLLENIFDVQTKIAEEVIKALDITVLEPEREELYLNPTDNLEAYDLFFGRER